MVGRFALVNPGSLLSEPALERKLRGAKMERDLFVRRVVRYLETWLHPRR